MAEEDPIPTRTAVAVAVAACSLTLAAGITAAALFGYVGPGRRSGSGDAAETASANGAAPAPPASGGVLVPGEPAPVAPVFEGDTAEPAGLVFASRHDDDEEEEHSRRGRNRRHHHEHDHDDD
jgi:hypothetical protein